MTISQLAKLLKGGQIAVIPTDTVYGLVGLALNKEIVEKIYRLRKRSPQKPVIILISTLNDLKLFGVKLNEKESQMLKNIWPNPVSVILNVKGEKWAYLHRGTNTLAFRIPKDNFLISLLKKVGPLVGPSANIEGQPPAEDITQAKNYFGNQVSYLNGGTKTSQPSTLVKIKKGAWRVLRPGLWHPD